MISKGEVIFVTYSWRSIVILRDRGPAIDLPFSHILRFFDFLNFNFQRFRDKREIFPFILALVRFLSFTFVLSSRPRLSSLRRSLSLPKRRRKSRRSTQKLHVLIKKTSRALRNKGETPPTALWRDLIQMFLIIIN
jgi:hypothetical protein